MGKIEWTTTSRVPYIMPHMLHLADRLKSRIRLHRKRAFFIAVLFLFACELIANSGITWESYRIVVWTGLVPQGIYWIWISTLSDKLKKCYAIKEITRTHQSRGGRGWWKW